MLKIRLKMPSLIETKANFCMVKVLLRLFIFAAAFFAFCVQNAGHFKGFSKFR